jgi:hypothetical protein
VLVKPIAKALVHRRHPKQHRAALVVVPSQLGNHRLWREGHEGGPASAEEGAVEPHSEAMKMEQRKGMNEDVARCPAPYLYRAARLRQQAAVVEDRPLWATGGP